MRRSSGPAGSAPPTTPACFPGLLAGSRWAVLPEGLLTAESGPVAWLPVPVRTGRLVLRASEAGDRAVFIELFASPEVGAYLGGPRPRDELECTVPAVPGWRPGLFMVERDGTVIDMITLDRRGAERLGTSVRRRGRPSSGTCSCRGCGGAGMPPRRARRRSAGSPPRIPAEPVPSSARLPAAARLLTLQSMPEGEAYGDGPGGHAVYQLRPPRPRWSNGSAMTPRSGHARRRPVTHACRSTGSSKCSMSPNRPPARAPTRRSPRDEMAAFLNRAGATRRRPVAWAT